MAIATGGPSKKRNGKNKVLLVKNPLLLIGLFFLLGMHFLVVLPGETNTNPRPAAGVEAERRPIIFDSCRDPSAEFFPSSSNKDAPCAYLRLSTYAGRSSLDTKISDSFSDRLDGDTGKNATMKKINWDVFNNVAAKNGSDGWDWKLKRNLGLQGHTDKRRTYPEYDQLARQADSISILAAPKCGSRSLYTFFLDHVVVKGGKEQLRIGHMNEDFVTQLEERQKEERSIWAKENPFSYSAAFFPPSWWTKPVSSPHHPQSYYARRNIVLSVIRDPLPRFVSSVNQLLTMLGTRRCGGCDEKLRPCLTATSSTSSSIEAANNFLSCVVQSVEEHGFWNDHIIPWIHFIRTPLAGKDIEVVVFPIEEMATLLGAFGVYDNKNVMPDHGTHLNKFVGGKKMSTEGEQYRILAEEVRSTLTNNQLSRTLIQRLCQLYALDVEVMGYLGFQVTYCGE